MVGARSALFLPYPDLGLIVVDEEHDASFKQEDGVVYHARDMAVVRARISAASRSCWSRRRRRWKPSSTSSAAATRALHLPARHGGAALPEIALIDLRREPPPRQRWLSPPLRGAVTATLAAGEQAMLFLNRRGYAPLTLCRACGHRLQCPNCTTWLVEHRLPAAAMPPLRLPDAAAEACPSCSAEDSFAACGPGVERIAEEVTALFPDARIAVMTSDTISGPDERRRRSSSAWRTGEIDLLIGTQIVAKGHHFPMLTLVGVVDADLGLRGGDLRAGRAHLPAAAPGGGPRRPRRAARPRAAADLHARASGDARARRRRPRRAFSPPRPTSASALACRPSAGSRR